MAGEREVDLDDVLGEDRDERDQGHHEPVAEVDLRRLARPREQEGGRDDGGAVDEELQRIGRPPAGQPHQEPGRGAGRGAGQRPLPRRHAMATASPTAMITKAITIPRTDQATTRSPSSSIASVGERPPSMGRARPTSGLVLTIPCAMAYA